MKSSTIASVQKRCGLGGPPKQYDQNANEAMNSVIKKVKGKGIISVKDNKIAPSRSEKSRRKTKDEFDWKRRMAINKRSERCASDY